jgi:multifunctional 2-oxoglutarate metabolism enzyme
VKEANPEVSTQQTSQDNPLADFGPNEWIVDEMYQRYLADPTSVDPAWHDFFADYKPAMAAGSIATPDEATAANATASAKRAGTDAPAASTVAPVKPTVPAESEKPTAPEPAAKPAPTSAPATKPSPNGAVPSGATVVPLRGVAARIVQNMDASLEVPTATSVRAVPAKLLVDNRIVINNHLARGRGGKVSFTHLIGFAMVRAVIAHPEMNNSFAEVDGKPSMIEPEHVNLGIAIDLWSFRRSRTARRWTSGSSGRRTRTSSGAPAAAS